MSVTVALVILLVSRMFRWCDIIVGRFKMSLNDKLVNNCFVCILLTPDRFISGSTILGINQTRHHLHTHVHVFAFLSILLWRLLFECQWYRDCILKLQTGLRIETQNTAQIDCMRLLSKHVNQVLCYSTKC